MYELLRRCNCRLSRHSLYCLFNLQAAAVAALTAAALAIAPAAQAAQEALVLAEVSQLAVGL